MNPILSICIATKNRANYLEETLLSILIQKSSSIEIVILDSSSDNQTRNLIEKLNLVDPIFKYIKNEKLNLDEGYDEAVMNSNGLYCWLLPDDDLIIEETIYIILNNIALGYDLILLNLECYNKEMTLNLKQKLKNSETDLIFSKNDLNNFLTEMGILLSYIGSVIIKKSIWMSKPRLPYFGSWFVHVGVILASDEINRILYISEPLIKYRSGNSSWTAKSFEIWYIKWPELIWSFSNFNDSIMNKIAPKESWNLLSKLIKSRAMGEYDFNIYKKYIKSNSNTSKKIILLFISKLPVLILNTLLIIYCSIFRRYNKYTIYNFVMSSPNKTFSLTLTKIFFLKFV
jgi:abequosyltransferase